MLIRFVTTLALTLVLMPFAAMAATIEVDGTVCSLTDAILAANTDTASGGCPPGDTSADTIVLNSASTLLAADTVNSVLTDGAYAGLPTITSEISIEAGTASLIERDSGLGCVDNDPTAFRIFSIDSGGVLTLGGLTITNGCSAGKGGAIAIIPNNGGVLTVLGCTFSGNTTVSGSSGRGGAIWQGTSGHMSVTDSTFTGNVASGSGSPCWGGAIAAYGEVTAMNNNTFDGNQVLGADRGSGSAFLGAGGAVYLGNTVTSVSNNTFTGNTAQGGAGSSIGGGGLGGALYQEGSTIQSFTNNIFDGNRAIGGTGDSQGGGNAGGGGALLRAVVTSSNNLFVNNLAQGGDSTAANGGDARCGGLAVNISSELHLTSIVNNTARGGDGATDGGDAQGGGYGYYSTQINSTISGNTAEGGTGGSGTGGDAHGGGWFTDDDVYSHHVTVAGNNAIAGAGTVDGTAAGGGIYIDDDYAFYLSNSILADNTITPAGGSATADDCGWGPVSYDQSAGYNLIEAPGTCVFSFAATDVTGVDPVLAGLVGSDCTATLPDGSCIQTMALASTSPAIDAGSCTTSDATIDQRGYARPFDEPAATNIDDGCDTGAFEWTDNNGNGVDDGVEIFADGFESGDVTSWSVTIP